MYLDHNATTPIDPEVVETMLPYLTERYGNPSAIHSSGSVAKKAIESARRIIAQVIGTTARRIIFTGSGSESDNLAIKGVVEALSPMGGGHIITSVFEHPAVLNTCRQLERMGYEVTYLDVDEQGIVSPDELRAAIKENTLLVSIMLANNELGTIQPIRELADIAHERDALFHADAVQALGKIAVDVDELGVDLLSFSSHKIHGPKGVGALYVAKGVELLPLVNGGKQEGGIRAGTENVAGIAGFAKAAEIAARRLPDMEQVAKVRDRLEAGVTALAEGARLNGHRDARLPNTLSMTIPGMRGESLVYTLDRKGVAVSSGSACKSGSPDPSHALMALGLSTEDAHCTVRFSLGAGNSMDEIEYVLKAMAEVIEESFSSVQFVPCR